MDFQTSHPFLLTYLKYVENTESPRLFHVWSALSCVSASLGRRCWFPTALGPMWPNMYIALVGQPATRKGTAIKIATNLLRATTKVKFAPNDTGGQRQGLIRAMLETGNEEDEKEIVDALAKVGEIKFTLDSISNPDAGLDKLAGLDIDLRDPHSMFAAASEFNSLIGENNTSMLTFLQEMWDGVPYRYQLKATTQSLENALLNILAGTTPSQISISMPPEAMGGGFTSRIIFVFGAHQYKRIARPSLDTNLEGALHGLFTEIFYEMEGAFTETKPAADLIDAIYLRGVSLNDHRFLHYCDRRGDHLRKLSMALAASCGRMVIQEIDVDVADKLLQVTEQDMPDALGEYGMDKLSASKQKLLEFVRGYTGPIPMTSLYGYMARDMSLMDFKKIISDLHNGKKLSVVTLPDLGQCVVATDATGARKAKYELSEITDALQLKRA